MYEFDMYLGKKGNTEFVLGESVILSLCQKLKDTYCFVFANLKNMPVLKYDKEMKRGEHDWFSTNLLSVIKWMDNKSAILLSNHFNPKETQQIERRVKSSKDKVKVTCPSAIQEHNQFMGCVDLSDQMKVTYELDHRSKCRFYLRVFFDFLDIAVVN